MRFKKGLQAIKAVEDGLDWLRGLWGGGGRRWVDRPSEVLWPLTLLLKSIPKGMGPGKT